MTIREPDYEPTADPVALLQAAADGQQALAARIDEAAQRVSDERERGAASAEPAT